MRREKIKRIISNIIGIDYSTIDDYENISKIIDIRQFIEILDRIEEEFEIEIGEFVDNKTFLTMGDFIDFLIIKTR